MSERPVWHWAVLGNLAGHQSGITAQKAAACLKPGSAVVMQRWAFVTLPADGKWQAWTDWLWLKTRGKTTASQSAPGVVKVRLWPWQACIANLRLQNFSLVHFVIALPHYRHLSVS